MNDSNARQQIVDSIKSNNNILVSVSTNPSVDELSAALGFTILLNNLGKKATAVVSGQMPPAINFLEPEKTFENTTDSLRDFIIALDKEKADHLRYKVEGDVVKIFITPYKTQLSDADLEYSYGDYNVEVVVALGVTDASHLDRALDAQGSILHDATVTTLTAGNTGSTLGSINWQDTSASSLCEMLVSLSEALKEDKQLLDQQTSTAFLTGIVSATDRFSNDHTTSRVMTMAAQLMAAGANQQLIAAKLEEAHDIGPGANNNQSMQNYGGSANVSNGAVSGNFQNDGQSAGAEGDFMMSIDHPEPSAQPQEVAAAPAPEASYVPDMNAQQPAVAPVEAAPAPEAPAMPPVEMAQPAPEVAEAQPAPVSSEESPEEALARELSQVVPQAPPIEATPVEPVQEDLVPPALEPVVDTPAPVADQVPELPNVDLGTLPPPPPEAPVDLPPPPPPPAPEPELTLPPPPTGETSITTHAAAGGSYVADATQPTPLANSVALPDEPPVPDTFAAPILASPVQSVEPDPAFESKRAADPAPVEGQLNYEESPSPADQNAAASLPDFTAMSPTGVAKSSGVSAAPSLDALPPPPPLPDMSAAPPPPPDLNLPAEPTPAASGDSAAPGQFKIPGQ